MSPKVMCSLMKEDHKSPTSGRCRRHGGSLAEASRGSVQRSPVRAASDKPVSNLSSSYGSSSKSSPSSDRTRSPSAPDQRTPHDPNLKEKPPSPNIPPTCAGPSIIAKTPPTTLQTSLTSRRQSSPSRSLESKNSTPNSSLAKSQNIRSIAYPYAGDCTLLIAWQTFPNPYLQWMLPGHRYLGPLIPPHGTPPADEDDAITQAQVLEYMVASSEGDIRRADRTAMSRLGKNFITSLNWHSALLLCHLAMKYLLESLFGVAFLIPLGEDNRHEETTSLNKKASPSLQRKITPTNSKQPPGVSTAPRVTSPGCLLPHTPSGTLLTTIPSIAAPVRHYTTDPYYTIMRLEKQLAAMTQRIARLERSASVRGQSPSP